jgi:hypothetical protein
LGADTFGTSCTIGALNRYYLGDYVYVYAT